MPAAANSITVTMGSPVVTGYLTSFVAAEDDIFILNGVALAVASRDSSSQITLKQPWPGASFSGVAKPNWTIVNTGPYWQSAVAMNQQLSALLRKFEAGPVKWDASDTLAHRSQYDGQPKDFVFLSVDPLPFTLYVKLSSVIGDWSAGQALQLKADTTAESEAARDVAQQAAGTAVGAAGTASAAATATAGDRAQTAQDRQQTSSDRTATTTARDSALAAATSAAQVAPNRTYETLLSELASNSALAVGTVRQVSTDPNSGTYELRLVNGTKTWVRTGATVPAIDALTAFVRQVLVSTDDGAFNLTDLAGNIGMRFDGANGLQAALAQVVRLVSSVSASSRFEVPGAFSLTANAGDGALIATDPEGNIGLRLDGAALTVANLIVTGLLSLSGGVSATSYSFGGCSLSTYPDPNVAFIISDTNGWILLALMADGRLIVPSIQTATIGTGGDYSADFIAERSNRAVALSAGYRGLLDSTSAAAVWAYNQAFVYGQSLGSGQEGWPARTLAGRSDVLMLGQSVRPGGNNAAVTATPLGDSVLRPAVATVQNINTGALIDAAGQAALPAGDPSLGEEIGVAAMLFARRLFLQRLGQQAADDRRFVVTNVSVSGRSIEELSKGAATEFFNRLRTMSTAVKSAATAAGGSYGVAALFWLQGEYNYLGTPGSAGQPAATDKASYKAALKKLYDDFFADVCVGIAGQSERPAIITYQTGGSYTRDTTDMSVGMAQWELSQENPSWYLAAPAYPVTDKGGHLDANGYRWLALQMGKVFHEVVVMRRKWKPLSPIQATVRGRTVLVDFHLASGTPLQFKSVYVGSGPTEFQNKGFTVIDSSGTIPLGGVSIVGDAVVQIILQRAPVGPVNVYYGRQATFNGGGNLCDSDPTEAPFVYEYTAGSGDYAAANNNLVGKPYPLWNWCIAFKMTAVAN